MTDVTDLLTEAFEEDREGLRPIDEESTARPPTLTPERVRLICYQVVRG